MVDGRDSRDREGLAQGRWPARLPDRVRLWPRAIGYGWGPRFMSRLRKRWVLIRNAHADVRFIEPVYLGPGFSLHIPYKGTFVAGPRVEFRRGFRAELGDGARLTIGEGSVFTNFPLIQVSSSIDIGERCMFGQATSIFDGNHRFRDLDTPMLDQGYDLRPIRIQDDVTTTTKCTIIASIGTRTVVGANTVVTRDLPPYCVVVGSPAQVIDYFGPEGGEPEELRSRSAKSG